MRRKLGESEMRESSLSLLECIALRRADKMVDKSSFLRMMPLHACDAGASRNKAFHPALGFYLPLCEHDRALVGRAADYLLGLRAGVLRIDQRGGNDRPLGVLRDAGPQRPAEFQNHGDDLWRH